MRTSTARPERPDLPERANSSERPERPERLVSPLSLTLVGAAFALAFAVLRPGGDTFRFGNPPSGPVDADAAFDVAPIDELDLAYLRARAKADAASPEELATAIAALVRARRFADAETLLGESRAGSGNARARFAIALERAAAIHAGALHDGADAAMAARALRERAESALLDPALRERASLERAAGAALALGTAEPAASLYRLLADVDAERAALWLTRCADVLVRHDEHDGTIDCLERALAAAPDADAAFALELRLLGTARPVGAGGSASVEPIVSARVEALLGRDGLSPDALARLATALLAIERPLEAARAYERLASVDPDDAGAALQSASRWSEAGGRPGDAAAFAERAAELAASDSERRRLQRRAQRLLLAAGREREALSRLLARVAANPDDVALLDEAITLSRRLGDVARARTLNARRLLVEPRDLAALERQSLLAQAEGDLPGALEWSEHAVRIAPDDDGARRRLARVREWSGDPSGAQREWREVVARAPDAESLNALARLAEANLEFGVAAEALARSSTLGPADAPTDAATLARRVHLHELEGRPAAAAAALEAELARPAGRDGTTALLELARLHERHAEPRPALRARERLAARIGPDPANTLARVALHWRLNEPEQAAELIETSKGTLPSGDALLAGAASAEAREHRVGLLVEIAWQYAKPWLAQRVEPLIAELAQEDLRRVYGWRIIDTLRDSDELEAARLTADALWRDSGEDDFALIALALAVEADDADGAAAYVGDGARTASLRELPDYWTHLATLRLRDGDAAAARHAWERALELDPDDEGAIGGLLWMLIGAGAGGGDGAEAETVARLLREHAALAERTPALHAPFAIAHLQRGDALESLAWFRRIGPALESDYGLLLSYADALDEAARAEQAHDVRAYALRHLRATIGARVGAERDALLRDYLQLASRYGAGDTAEAWTRFLLAEPTASGPLRVATNAAGAAPERTTATVDDGAVSRHWRDDVAIAWLLAGGRHEHARLVMTRLHEARLTTPAWQALAVAMAADELDTVERILASGEPLSAGDRIGALRVLGREPEAAALADAALARAGGGRTRRLAAARVASLRGTRPSFAEAFVRRDSGSGFDTDARGIGIHHTFADSALGFSIDAVQRHHALPGSGDVERRDLAVALHWRDGLLDASLAAGIVSDEETDLPYAAFELNRRTRPDGATLSFGLAVDERADESAALGFGAVRDRLTLGFESAARRREFVRLEAEAIALHTREADAFVGRGLAARAEVGLRGAFGSTLWSASVAAAHVSRQRAEALPATLALAADTSFDGVLAERASSLALNASLSRGGLGGGYPQGSSPRYFVDTTLGSAWPERDLGLRLSGGVGVRVLGGDELALTFSRGDALLSEARTDEDDSAIGVSYRYHFP